MNVFLSIKILNGNKVIDKQILHFLIDLVEAIKMRKESQMSDHLTRSYKLQKNMSKSYGNVEKERTTTVCNFMITGLFYSKRVFF